MRFLICLSALAALSACDPDPPAVRDDAGMDTGTRRDSGADCRDDQIQCDGICVTTETNPLNCGRCGNECESDEACERGICRSRETCPSGEMDCGGGCTDVGTDAMNCGRCGNACADGETCARGGCQPAECEGETPDRCEDVCTDLQTDKNNCGACGTECSDTETCAGGSCSGACGAGEEVCTVEEAPVCINTMTDAAHCGSCGNACGDGESCNSGTCGCSADEELCGRACVNTMADPANCGGCDAACDDGAACVAGRCACAAGLEECAGRCVNTETEAVHCGRCGNECGADETCVAGACEGSGGCPAGETECGGSCVNLTTDTANCGACGTTCSAEQTCGDGACRPNNDLRANATALALPATGAPETEIVGSTDGATTDVPTLSCEASGPNVWYEITVAEAGVLWVDTAASDYDTAIFLTDSSGNQVSDMCNDDCPCDGSGDFGVFDSCMGKRLFPGTYFLSVGAYAADETGDFLLHAQFLPKGDSFLYGTRLDGMGTTPTTSLFSTGSGTGMCGGSATGTNGDDVRWFMACGGTEEHLFSVCPEDGGSWEYMDGMSLHDPVVYVRSGQTGAEEACDDDDFGAACQPAGGGPRFGSRITGHVAGRGVHAVYVDSRGTVVGSDRMSYQMAYQVPQYEF